MEAVTTVFGCLVVHALPFDLFAGRPYTQRTQEYLEIGLEKGTFDINKE